MNRMSTVEARDHLSDLINRVAYGKNRIVLTRRSQNVVAVVPLEDLELLEKLEDYIDLKEALEAKNEKNL